MLSGGVVASSSSSQSSCDAEGHDTAVKAGPTKRRDGGEGGAGSKAVNLFTAVNQALHIALNTYPQ